MSNTKKTEFVKQRKYTKHKNRLYHAQALSQRAG